MANRSHLRRGTPFDSQASYSAEMTIPPRGTGASTAKSSRWKRLSRLWILSGLVASAALPPPRRQPPEMAPRVQRPMPSTPCASRLPTSSPASPDYCRPGLTQECGLRFFCERIGRLAYGSTLSCRLSRASPRDSRILPSTRLSSAQLSRQVELDGLVCYRTRANSLPRRQRWCVKRD